MLKTISVEGYLAHTGDGYSLRHLSALDMNLHDDTIALTVTSPPYWNAIDYNIHARGDGEWHRDREYSALGNTYQSWMLNLAIVFDDVWNATVDGGFCAVVIGTILHDGKHYPAPFDLVTQLTEIGWDFHQDIVWNKVTGGVKRAGVFIQNPRLGYYYPNIMTEYIMVFRKGKNKRRGTEDTMPIDDVFTRDIANNVWHIAPVPPKTVDHPCPFPDELASRLIRLYSQAGDTVLDPFLGSGTTARMAVLAKRDVIGYDIEQKYLHLAYNRLYKPNKRKYQLLPRVEKVEV